MAQTPDLYSRGPGTGYIDRDFSWFSSVHSMETLTWYLEVPHGRFISLPSIHNRHTIPSLAVI